MELQTHDQELNNVIFKVRHMERITPQEALLLYDAPLSVLSVLAIERKVTQSGDKVYFNRNFHIEPTNICLFGCKFCSYRRGATDPEAWDYSLEELLEIVERRKNEGATEVHIVGGVHPDHNLEFYLELIRGVKRIMPAATVKAFTAIELHYMITKAGLSVEQGLKRLHDAGMEAIPGGGAEIFEESVRAKICPEKGTTEQWLKVHEEAHKLGIKTNATILYGHIESRANRIDHLLRLRNMQDQTHGFDAFIPLKYRSRHNSMSHMGEVSIVEDMRTMAISRIFLDNFLHIKAYWPMFGKQIAQIALCYGADDIDGTIEDSTKIYSMAGAEDQNPSLNVEQIKKMVEEVGFIAVERDTFYNEIN